MKWKTMRVLYIDIDSLRPDHLGCYGYGRTTSPNLDAIAADGIRLTHLYASDTPCVPSRASFMSGKFGLHHGALTHWGPGSEFRYPGHGHRHYPEDPVFPRLLRQNGIRPVTFSSFADRHLAWWFLAGWSEAHGYTERGGSENAGELNAAALPWLKRHAREENWFLHLQYWDPHRNYTMPPEWMEKVEGPLPGWPGEAAIAEHRKSTGPFSALFLFNGRENKKLKTMPRSEIRGRAEAEHFLRGYDGAVRYMDEHVGEVVRSLQEAGVWDQTAVVVSADHGEALGEQGVYGDHCCAGETIHHLPGLIRWPGVVPGGLKGSANGAWLYNVDLIATITELLGIGVPPGWNGRSFAPALRGEAFEERPYLVWGHALYSCQRAVRTPRWLLRRTYHPGLFPFPDLELFEMENDPHETRDVSKEHPEAVKELIALLEAWQHEHLGRPGARPDPMQKVVETGPWKYVSLEPWLAMLRAKGRDDLAVRIEKRLGSVGGRR